MRANESDSRKNFTRANSEATANASDKATAKATAKFGAGASRANGEAKANATAKATAAAQALYKAKYFVIALLLAVVAITSVGVSKWNIHIQQVYNNNFSYVNSETTNTILTRYLTIDYTETAPDTPNATPSQTITAYYLDTSKTATFIYNDNPFQVTVSDTSYNNDDKNASSWSKWAEVGLGFSYTYYKTHDYDTNGNLTKIGNPTALTGEQPYPTKAGVYQCVITAKTNVEYPNQPENVQNAVTTAIDQLNCVQNDGTKCAAVISFTIKQRDIKAIVTDKTSTYGDQPVALTATTNDVVAIADDTEANKGKLSEDLNSIVRLYTTTTDQNGETIEYPLTNESPAGKYGIEGTTINDNYKVTFVYPGKATQPQGQQTVAFNGEREAEANPLALYVGAGATAVSFANNTASNTAVSFANNTAINVAGKPQTQPVANGGVALLDGESPATGNVNGTYTITTRNITVTIENKSSTYGNPLEPRTYKLTSGSLANGNTLEDIISVTTTATSTSDVGEYPITGSQYNADGQIINANYAVTFQNDVYTITKRPVTITWGETAFSYVYNGAEQKPNPTFKGLLSGLNHNATVTVAAQSGSSLSDNKSINKGNYTMTVALPSQNYKWEGTEDDSTDRTQGFSITARPITVTIDNQTSVYGDNIKELTAQVTSTHNPAIVTGDNESNIYTLSAKDTSGKAITNKSPVGTYDIIGECINANYAVTFVGKAENGKDGVYTIKPAEITNPQITPYSGTYDGKEHNVTTSVTAETVNSQPLSYKYSTDGITWSDTLTIKNAETITFSVKLSAPNHNTLTLTESYTATINKAELTATASSHTVTYGDDAPSYTITYSGFVNGETDTTAAGFTAPTISCNYKKGSPVTTDGYAVTLSGGSATNYSFKLINGKVTVNKATVTVPTATSAFVYDGTEHTAITGCDTALITIAGINTATDAGNYTATATLKDTTNYKWLDGDENATKSFNWAITAAPLTVKADNFTITKGSPKPTFTATYDGFVNNETPSVLSGTLGFDCSYNPSTSDAGTYTITPKGLTSNNYIITFQPGTLTVTQAAVVDKPTQKFTTATYDGTDKQLLDGVDLKKMTVTLNGTNVTDVNALKAKNAGTYTVTVALKDTSATWSPGGGNAPLTFTFTINPKPVTITWGTTEFTYNGAAQAPSAPATGFIGNDSLTLTIKDSNGNTITEAKNAGSYTAVATFSQNYTTTSETTKSFTIGKKSLTITATSTKTTFVYGEKVYNAVSYETSGLVSGETITGLTYTYPTNKELTQNLLLDVGDYTISANVNNATTNGVLLSVNYNVTCYPVQVTVNALKVKLEGTLVYPYGTNTTLTYKKGMFNGKFVSSNNPGNYDLSDLHNSISSAIAQNYIGEATEANESAGKFYYTLDTQIKAGSTYRLSATLSGSNIVCDNDNSALYLKYQTAMIGSTYYTIEDALNKGGNITLAGNNGTLDKTNYVITSFSHLTDYYNNKTTYTLDDTLNLPVNSSGTVLSGPDTTVGKDGIYSVLIITKNINLIINGTMNIGGHIFANGNTKMTVVYERSVVMNNGNITLNGTINANGFLKGNYDSVEKKHIGLITANYGSEIIDWMRPFNWPGGTITNGLHNKKIFPFEAYTLHNNSCDTKINPGATYMAKLAITASVIGTNTGSVNVVAPSEAMFTITTGYIMKTVSDDDLDVTEITGSNQGNTGGTKQHDVITIYGECHDNQINATIAGKTITTSTDYPLPIGFMDIVVATDRAGNNGKLTLAACSYKFYPGSKLIVEQNAELIVGSSASLTFYDYETCIIHENKDTGSPSKAKYSPFIQNVNDKVDAKLVVNGTATVNGSIGGLIITNASEALLTISKNTSSIKIVTKAGFVAEVETVTFTATGVQTAGGSATTLNGGNNGNSVNYSSVGSAGNYYWVLDDRIKTVTFKYNDGTDATYFSTTVILTNGSYTLQSGDFPTNPTRDHYIFGGWFTDKNGIGTEVSAGYPITDDITLYAKWTPETYTIIYHYVGCTEDQANTITNPNESTYTYDTELPLNEATIGSASGLSFGGWFTDKSCTHEISKIAKGTYGNLTLYGKWTAETPKTYEITLQSGKSGVTLATSTLSATGTKESGANYKIPAINATWNNDTTTAGINGEWLNNNYNFDSYFIGWKLTYKLNGVDKKTDYDGNAPTITFDGGAENITLTARWAPKIKLTIEFKNTKSNELLQAKTKYFMSSDEPIPLSLINESIRTAYDNEINSSWTDHTEYYFDKWLENGTETESIVLDKDKTLTAQYKRCYHVIITGNNVTGTGTEYVAPTKTSYNIVVSGNISENVHRYKITDYTCDSDTATVTNGTLNFNGADSATDITVTVTTIKQWAVLLEGVNDGGSVTISVNGVTQPKATSPGNSQKVLIGYFDEGNKVKIVDAEKPSGSDNGPEVTPSIGSETTLSTVFIITVNSSTKGCLVKGTLITLADGSKKKVEDLTVTDNLLVLNHETGKLEAGTLLVNCHSEQTVRLETRVINLYFSNGSTVRIAWEHGFFDVESRKYIYIDEVNVNEYVGHRFYGTKYVNGKFVPEIVTLNSYTIVNEFVRVFSPATVWHFNIFAEDILSMPADIDGVFGIFELDEDLKYDPIKKQADIDKYGLYTYEDWQEYMPYEVYQSIPFAYFKVAMGKGYITKEGILRLYNAYIVPYLKAPDAENSGGQNLPDPPSAPCDAFAPPGAVTPSPSPSSEDDKED